MAAKTNSIVVNINYRLGILGFGYLEGSNDIPGNMGLLDQQMGMKWVYENIRYFGGDNERITIWGESAGSVSVNAHLYAPGSRKYFSRALSNSGIVDSVWGKYSNQFVHNVTVEVAKKLKCEGDVSYMAKCLTKVGIDELIVAGSQVQASTDLVFHFVFSPVEYDVNFFQGNVTQKIERHEMKRNVDLFIGNTANEFTYFLPTYFFDERFGCGYDTNSSAASKKNACDIKKVHFNNIFEVIQKQLKIPQDVIQRLSKMYRKYGVKFRDSAAKFLAEVYFDCDILKYIINISEHIKGHIYYYEFNVISSSNPWPKWMGAMHGYELEYEFGMPFRRPETYKKSKLYKEKKFSKNFMKLIGNFASTGNPSRKWKKFTKDDQNGALLVHQFSYKYIKHKKRLLTDTCEILSPYIPRRMV